MGYSYKTYTDTKEVMKKYVNAREGEIIYSIGKTRFMALAGEAGAIYKVGNSGVCQVKCVSFFRYHKRRCVTSDCWL